MIVFNELDTKIAAVENAKHAFSTTIGEILAQYDEDVSDGENVVEDTIRSQSDIDSDMD